MTDAPDAPGPLDAPPPPPPADETIKETFESIIIAFILAFVFRAYVVEAFVIPTGSMAPTLLGAHLNAECEQCGYQFKINFNTEAPERWQSGATCPMCRYNITLGSAMAPPRVLPGDRILVHKYIYTVSEPRRWDVVVFKAPHQPNINFIKRLVGLPNETVQLLDGNVYTQNEGETLWRIARKGDSPKVQRAVWQPIYYSQYIPRDHGELKGPGERSPQNRWSVPWVIESGQWDIEGRRSYRYQGGEDGQIAFDFNRAGSRTWEGLYPYNQHDNPTFNDSIEDIRLAVSLQPESSDSSIRLITQTRLEGEPQSVTARVDVDGTITLSAYDPVNTVELELMTVKTDPLKPGVATPIELWAVDQELSVWIDGRRELRYLYASELTPSQLFQRPPPLSLPKIRIRMTGGPATLYRVKLDRDIYYASRIQNRFQQRDARGGMIRDAQGRVMPNTLRAMRIHDDEFFCIGDNNPLSDDGRFWGPDPNDPHAQWVRYRYFGKSRDDASRDGIVPSDLMMGRAFFVYFPAPHTWSERGPGVIPNFADMRFIH